MLRLFVAVELTAGVRRALAAVQDGLRRQLPPRAVRWTNPDHIHLTLKFLGDAPAEQVGAVGQALAAAAGGFAPFDFAVTGFGCFPNPRRANVLWAGVPDVPRPLAGLQRATDLQLSRLGFELEARPFSPHLTLGRVHKSISPQERERLAAVLTQTQVGALGIVPVSEVVLFQSDLRPDGPVYRALARVPLAGQDGSEERR